MNPVIYELGESCIRGKPAQDGEAECGASDSQSEKGPADNCEKTTVMLKNLPNNYSRDMFLKMLDDNGFQGLYDFVYLPFDFFLDANLGYAFVNMVSAKSVDRFRKTFEGFADWSFPSAKVCEVKWGSDAQQGLDANIARYRNSPVMHKKVPDEFKPLIFQNGVRQPFPKPTKRIRLKAPFPFWDCTLPCLVPDLLRT